MLLPLRGVATPGHGEGEGSAVDKFRVSGTQETVEGAGANEVSGVLSEASCCRCGAPLIKKKRPTLFSRPHLHKTKEDIRLDVNSRTSATAGAVYLPKANTEGGAAGYNRGRAPMHRFGHDAEPHRVLRHFLQKSPDSILSGLFYKKWRRPTLPHGSAVPSARPGLTSQFGMG